MAENEKSSKELASLAAKILREKSASPTEKRLAASVLTQAPDRKKTTTRPASSGGGKKEKEK